MLKGRMKATVIACVLVCILPTMSCAVDKDDFLKFLINSSYPESNVEKNKNKELSQNNNTTSTNKENTENKEYIKVHVGEENIPNINENKNTEESISVNNTSYKNDVRVTNNNPRILLYHTHSAETYSNSPEGNYHSADKPNSVLSVGTLLTEELNKKGWGVVHTTKYHDYPNYNDSYGSSYKTIQEMLSNYKSIDIAIDLHRDARDLNSKSEQVAENERMSATVNGEKVAKFFFVVGQRNPNVEQVRALAQDITNFAKKKYPDLVMPVVEKPFGKFNQYIAKNHMLIEVGSNGTSAQEAQASAKYVAEVLDEYFKTK